MRGNLYKVRFKSSNSSIIQETLVRSISAMDARYYVEGLWPNCEGVVSIECVEKTL